MYNLSNSKMASNFRCYTTLSIFYLFITFVSLSTFTSACHPITQDCPLKDGDVIVSENAKYALGFFSPKGSNLRYVGIWFNKIEPQSVVWVANRRNPISGNGGMLRIGALGNLMISNQTSDFIWSTLPKNVTNNLSAFLRDDGNLVLQVGSVFGGENNRALWKSSNQPTDTYLAGMRIYVDPSQSDIRRLTAWRSANDPSPGKYSLSIDPCGSPQFVIWEGTSRKWRSGYWNGIIFDGVQGMKGMYYNGFRFDNDDGKLYFIYTPQNSTDLIKSWIRWDGTEVQEKWDEELKKWDLMESYPIHGECDHYNQCGPFGICDFKNSPICSCIQGFVPKDLDQWKIGNFSGGCIRRTNLDCLYGVTRDGFFKAERVKLPDLVDYVGSENANECEKKCLNNCSCTAYAFVTGINCMIWRGQLIDLEQFQIGEINLFIRLHHSELEVIGGSMPKKIAIVAAIIAGVACLITSVWLFRLKMKGLRKRNNEMLNDDSMCVFRGELPRPCDLRVEGQQGSVTDQLLMYDFSCVAAATNNFSDENKLGHGGFGHVYKGTLPGTNQVIAVKRLSEKSRQGVEEFKNEIALMSKLQHRNLVRLLGYCIQGDERMILYEYMPNKSLASVLFDVAKKAQLDWRKRFDIIEGIARGILYLHRDSRVRIIHRDLKASNILLDEEMNPKISDFGMARIFGGNQNEVNTGRLVGTPGYMAPEYAMGGHFSVKSDVYSFGVLLLEIISGQKNMSFQSSDYSNVIGYAWELWNGGRAIELADPSIANLFTEEEMLRCIHIAMLCVQDAANDRPNMESVLLMLESNGELPKPMQPSLASNHGNSTEMWNECPPSNDLTMSTINGR